MINSNSQHRSYFCVCRLLAGLLLAAWLAPAARGDGWSFWPFNREEKPGKPDKIIALWSDTVLTQTGRPPIRGFGGRLMFYEGKKEEPIKVEGTLVVYAFDETDRDANNTRPDRKYVFTPQQLPLHYSKSKIGHSYSVWLPWDEVGGLQKEITLIVRFQPKEGAVAISDPCRQLLPGRIVPSRPKATAIRPPDRLWAALPGQGNAGVQPASYQAPVTDGTGLLTAEWQRRHISTTTIAVPSGSMIRAAISSPQVLPAAGHITRRGQGRRARRRAPRTTRRGITSRTAYRSAAASCGIAGLQLRSSFAPGRQWPLGEPLARLNRDHAPSPLHPAGSPSGLASQAPSVRPTAPQMLTIGELRDSVIAVNQPADHRAGSRGRMLAGQGTRSAPQGLPPAQNYGSRNYVPQNCGSQNCPPQNHGSVNYRSQNYPP